MLNLNKNKHLLNIVEMCIYIYVLSMKCIYIYDLQMKMRIMCLIFLFAYFLKLKSSKIYAYITAQTAASSNEKVDLQSDRHDEK